jgi:hypothetical protein
MYRIHSFVPKSNRKAICSLALENDDAETATTDSDVLTASSVSSDFFFFGMGDEKNPLFYSFYKKYENASLYTLIWFNV